MSSIEEIKKDISKKYAKIYDLIEDIWSKYKELQSKLNEEYRDEIIDSSEKIEDIKFVRWQDKHENPLWMQINLHIRTDKKKEDFDNYEKWDEYIEYFYKQDTKFREIITNVENDINSRFIHKKFTSKDLE